MNLKQDGRNNSCRKCDIASVGYEAECDRCEGRAFKYVGKTNLTNYTRAKHHKSNYRAAAAAAKLPPLPEGWNLAKKEDVKSFTWEHTRDKHECQVGDGCGMQDYRFRLSAPEADR